MAFSVYPINAGAAGFCERMPIDPEFPAGLNGSYEIVGKDALTGSAYTGTLVLGHGKNSYTLTRTVQGNVMQGDAWIERCGVDKIRTLVVRYHTEPVLEMGCSLSTDGGNYYRTTCRTAQGGNDKQGLEAWYQNP